MRKKITWVTAECFVDVDLQVIPHLSLQYNIEWYVVLESSSKINHLQLIKEKIKSTSVSLNIVKLKTRIRNPLLFLEYLHLIGKLKKTNPNLFYIDMPGLPYFLPLFRLFVGIRNSIIATHNVSTPKGAVNERIAEIYMRFTIKAFKNFHVFSESQKYILEKKTTNKKILLAPLALKDFGKSEMLPNNLITFLNFGIIREYKRVDILIQAANQAYELTGIRFLVIIAGACNSWGKYQNMIKYPFLFDLQIKSIPNEQVADLFATSHYFVLPYQDIAQSGALTVAFNYNLPVIASDLKAFREYVVDGKDGFLFEPGSVDGLSEIFINILKNHNSLYLELQKHQRVKIQDNYSIETIVRKYTNFFEKIV